MSSQSITIEAIFEGGVLRPVQPLPLEASERVTITVQLPQRAAGWPGNAAEIYGEIAAEDRRLAEAMLPGVRTTWPVWEG